MTDPLNLCDTVKRMPRYIMLPCVPRRRENAYFPHDPDAEFDRRHSWSIEGTCMHCSRPLREVRIRLNPKTGEPVRSSRLARAIATLSVDVPPVRFVGAQPVLFRRLKP